MSDTIKRVDAARFAEHAAELLAAGEPLDIEQDGRVIGRYRPVPVSPAPSQSETPPPNGRATNNGQATHDNAHSDADDTIRPEAREAIARLDQIIDEVLARTGMTEEEFASYFDMTKPFPYDKVPER